MTKIKNLTITNAIMLAIALYTYISIYAPSLLNFSNEPFVSKGGDHLTDGLLLYALHYTNLFIFSIVNLRQLIVGFTKNQKNSILIVIISIILMISIHLWKNNLPNQIIQVEELHEIN